jgi:hypothetical protein
MQRLTILLCQVKKSSVKKYLLFLIIGIVFFDCKKNNSGSSVLTGVYNEVLPYNENTRLNFINSDNVVISGGQLNNQPALLLGKNDYQIIGQKILFISDSVGIKDTTIFYFKLAGGDSLELRTCPFGDICMVESFSYLFKK